jgi:hypothetical protein
MPTRKTERTSNPTVRKSAKHTAARAKAAKTLPESMITGKASPAKAADGDKPVFNYISSLPQPQRAIAERVDALAAKTLPGLQRSVKWAYRTTASAMAGAFVAAASRNTSSSCS